MEDFLFSAEQTFFKYFKGCLPQILLGLFLNILTKLCQYLQVLQSTNSVKLTTTQALPEQSGAIVF